MRYLALVLFLIASPVFATTGNLTPNPVIDDVTDVVLEYFDAPNPSHGVLFASNGRVLTGFGFGPGDGSTSMGSVSGMISGGWWIDPVPFGTLSFLEIPQADIEDCIANYNTASFEYELGSSPTENMLEICEGMFPTLATTYYGVIENATWGSPNGFWGDTTPTEIMGDMTASVQNTGAQIWPLFAFVGVVLAFGIAGLVVMFIKNSIKPTTGRKEIINPGGTDIIYHSAEDLEFKREYGQPKRGRGRPRKYPL